jgi:2-polyprenyl-6-methoxyphenol hydroxylase-like FAD-dependent oxidoreductase
MREHGVAALQKLGLWQRVLDNEAMGGVMIMCDNQFNEWIRIDDGEHAKDTCRIDRAKLRTMLLEQLPIDDIMVWNRIAIGVDQEVGRDTATVRFTDGSVEHGCHLVIAADGARSKVRAHVAPEEKLNFLGVEMLTGEASFPNGLPASLSSGIVRSLLLLFSFHYLILSF